MVTKLFPVAYRDSIVIARSELVEYDLYMQSVSYDADNPSNNSVDAVCCFSSVWIHYW